MAQTKETTSDSLADLERRELALLLDRGVSFTVEYTRKRRGRGLAGLFARGKDSGIKVRETYEIRQPTLAVLDLLSSEWIEIDMDEAALKGANEGMTEEERNAANAAVLREAKRAVNANTHRAARIVAVAVLGEDSFISRKTASGTFRTEVDRKRIENLSRLFLHTVTPQKLSELANIITSIANLPGFINSMRLLSGARTTKPIEKRKESIERQA